MVIDEAGGMVTIPRGVKLDLGATAKALAADRAAAAAHAATGAGVLVSLGGDIAVAGPPPEGGWAVRAAEDHRDGPDAPGQTVTIDSGGLATSSTTVRRWGPGAHHIIDPDTGKPARAWWRTVCAAAASCVDANIATTAAIVRGESAARLAERAPDAGPARAPRRWGHHRRRLAARARRGSVAMSAHGPTALWYVTRGAGAMTLVLLTASVVLGIVEWRGWQPAGAPRFAVASMHRTVGLLALALLAVHVATTLLDPFPHIGLLNAAVPFVTSYRPLWVGLGTLAADVMVAVVVTSLVRRRLGYRAWRGVHWLSYACWPVALLHGIGAGSDTKSTWMLGLTLACVAAVVVALGARVAAAGTPQLARSRRHRRDGYWRDRPGGLAAAGAARARMGAPRGNAPRTVLAGFSAAAPAAGGRPRGDALARPFSTSLDGEIRNGLSPAGTGVVDLRLRLREGPGGVLTIRLGGDTLPDGGLQMNRSAVTLRTVTGGGDYRGRVEALSGTDLRALVGSADGHALRLSVSLALGGPTVTGQLQGRPVPARGA